MKNRKQVKFLLICILLISITVGYAFLNTTLSIKGTANIESNTWSVKFSSITSETVTGHASITTPAEIITTTSPDDTVTFNVNLSKPGDMYKLIVNRKNAGTINAILDSYTVEGLEDTSDYLEFFIDDPLADENYVDQSGYGNLLSKPDLNAGVENYIVITLKYKEDITESQLLKVTGEKDIIVKLNYIQRFN